MSHSTKLFVTHTVREIIRLVGLYFMWYGYGYAVHDTINKHSQRNQVFTQPEGQISQIFYFCFPSLLNFQT